MVVIIYLIYVYFFDIVENSYTSIIDSIDKISSKIECKNNCHICKTMINDNLHYEGHIIRHLKDQCVIDNLAMGSVLLGDLEKFGWVVLRCAFQTINGSDTQRHFYYLNNEKHLKRLHYWNKLMVLIEKCCMVCKIIHMTKDFVKHLIWKQIYRQFSNQIGRWTIYLLPNQVIHKIFRHVNNLAYHTTFLY